MAAPDIGSPLSANGLPRWSVLSQPWKSGLPVLLVQGPPEHHVLTFPCAPVGEGLWIQDPGRLLWPPNAIWSLLAARLAAEMALAKVRHGARLKPGAYLFV